MFGPKQLGLQSVLAVAVGALVALSAAEALAQAAGAAAAPAERRTAQARTDHAARQAERFMQLFDTDRDGAVSVEEILAEQGRLFVASDVDGDGKLSTDEFQRRGHLFLRLGSTTLFDMLDADGSRELTKEEIDAPSSRWFSRYDADGNGTMSSDEIRAGRTRR